MKNFDFGIYNEKLKINPVSLKTFDSIKLRVVYKILKENLCTFDIIQFAKNNKLYMTFLSDTVHRLNIIFGDEKYYESIFFWAEPAETHFMTFNRYNDNLSHVSSDTWNIVEIYKCPKNFVLKLDAKELNQHTLKDIIIEEKYLKIK